MDWVGSVWVGRVGGSNDFFFLQSPKDKDEYLFKKKFKIQLEIKYNKDLFEF